MIYIVLAMLFVMLVFQIDKIISDREEKLIQLEFDEMECDSDEF